MDFGKTMRVQVVVAGLGLALFGAGTTKAQEIGNTRFDDGPNVVALAQPAAGSANAATAAGGPSVTAEVFAPVQAHAAESVSGERTRETMLWLGASLVWLGDWHVFFWSGEALCARNARDESYKVSREA